MKKKIIRTLLLFVLTIAITPSYLRVFAIAGPSMSPTVLLGDKVAVNMASYDIRLPYLSYTVFRLKDPSRGDLVIYDDPRGYFGLKRIVGLPGDKIELVANQIYINDEPIRQVPSSSGLSKSELENLDLGTQKIPLGDIFVTENLGGNEYTVTFTPNRSQKSTYGPVIVPDESYFILADHRDNSGDSRFDFQGFISRSQIKGRMFSNLSN